MLGYLGEGVILEATALGIGTCWVGGLYRHSVVNKVVQVGENERILAVTPLGYANTPRWDEKLMKQMARSGKRKSLAEIAQPTPEEWPQWARTALEAARLAPSALNRQPWQFTWQNGVVSISVGKGIEAGSVTRRLDGGIAMLHFAVGAAQAGASGAWEWAEAPQIGLFKLE